MLPRAALLCSLFALPGCRCDNGNVSARYGELVIVQLGSTGRELLLTEATVTAPPAYMNTEGTGEVPVRNVGRESVSIASVTRLEGDESLTLDGAVGLTVAADDDAVLPVRFAPPQDPDATRTEVLHRARFEVRLTGAAPGAEVLTVTLEARALARDCFVPARLDFGQVPLQRTVIHRLRLENGAALPATTTRSALSGADPGAFVLDGPETFEVPATGSLELPVRFQPLEARAYEARFTMRRAAGCPEATVTLTGEGNDAALTWTPERLDFGRLPLGVGSTKAVTFTNNSGVALSLAALLPSPDFALEAGAPTTVPAHGTATVEVTCRPATLGPLSAQLTVELGTEPVTPARLPLTCIGGGPRIRADPNPFSFGAVPYNSTGTAVTRRRLLVQNVGTAPATPGDTSHNLRLGRDGALPWFAIVPKNAQTRASEFSVGLISAYDPAVGLPAIAGKNYLEFEVRFAPTSAAERQADLLIYSNDAKEPVLRVPLAAFPRAPESCQVIVAPEGFNFGASPRGATSRRAVTVTNTSASAGGQCLVSGIELAPGSDLAFRVVEPLTGSLLVPSGGRKNIVVEAVVAGDAEAGDYLRGTLRMNVSSQPDARLVPVDLLVSRCLVVDPPVLDLGLVQQNCVSAGRPVTLYNVCGVPITIASVPAPAAPFRITAAPPLPHTLMPAGTAAVMVAAAPATAGTWADTLRIDTEQAGVPFSDAVALRLVSDPVGIQEDAFTQTSAPVDILFVVDDSCSMGDEQAALASNFAAFISATTQGTGDWHIGVTTTDTFSQRGRLTANGHPAVLTPTTPNVATAFAQNVQVGTSGSGFEQPFAAMELALTEPNRSGANAGFLRANAALAVVIVTDALEQSGNSVGSYLTTLRTAKGNRNELVNVSVVGPFSPPGASCQTEGAVDDGRYASIVTQTNGERADICTSNWASDLENLSRNVFSARRSFTLSGTPRSAADVTVLVDGMTASTGWRLDTATNAVVFTTPPQPGANIVIRYRTACF